MTKAFPNEISHRHKPGYLSSRQIVKNDEQIDWCFRRCKKPATEDDTEIVLEMRKIASDPQVWEACGLPSGKREEALGVCTAWLESIGAEGVVHGERE